MWRDEPVAAAGARLMHPNVASIFMFGTAQWPKVALDLTGFFRNKLFPTLKAAGVHRVQALALAEDLQTSAWTQQLFGTEPEATLRAYGKNGEDFVLHAMNLRGD